MYISYMSVVMYVVCQLSCVLVVMYISYMSVVMYVVCQVYAKAIADYRAGLSAKDHKVHDITKKLELEIAEICKPVDVIEEAGNVYVTHPVLHN
jgi:hypothetical protein